MKSSDRQESFGELKASGDTTLLLPILKCLYGVVRIMLYGVSHPKLEERRVVEAPGIEPGSEKETHKASTCLVYH
jgi:hypothetical protein